MMTINEYFNNLYNEALNANTLEVANKLYATAKRIENKVAAMFADYELLEEGERGNTKFEKWCKTNNIKIEDDETITMNWLFDNDRIKN